MSVWHSPGEQVAVKTAQKESDVIPLLEEGVITWSMTHPNVIKMHGAVTSGGCTARRMCRVVYVCVCVCVCVRACLPRGVVICAQWRVTHPRTSVRCTQVFQRCWCSSTARTAAFLTCSRRKKGTETSSNSPHSWAFCTASRRGWRTRIHPCLPCPHRHLGMIRFGGESTPVCHARVDI
jgi:hypothetical protein